jgi:membrane-bound lytic murein transglycosylase A
MKALVTVASLFLALFAACAGAESDRARASLEAVVQPTQVPFGAEVILQRDALLQGIEHNLSFLQSTQAEQAYQLFADPRITRARVEKSLVRFKELLQEPLTSEQLAHRVRDEFELYRSKGNDGRGTVKFTGYFQPVYRASRTKTERYRYPLYTLPENYSSWSKPHPTRVTLEGYDGLGGGLLAGKELVYLASRYEAFMVHVQGSAIIEFDDGTSTAVGFAGGTEYPFRGVSKKYLKEKNVRWSDLRTFFLQYPQELDAILSKNNRYIFFKENPSTTPLGSLGVPVLPESSIATDKLKLPPGALGMIRTTIPVRNKQGSFTLSKVTQVVLDQDTGSAIKGPGRVDIFMGTGSEAQKKANSVYAHGELLYLLVKE